MFASVLGNLNAGNGSSSATSPAAWPPTVARGSLLTAAARRSGAHVRGWRMVLGLTAQQVSERAGITRDTLRKIETGDSSAGFGNVAQVLRALGVLDQVVEAVDPMRTDIGRLRAGSLAKKRAR